MLYACLNFPEYEKTKKLLRGSEVLFKMDGKYSAVDPISRTLTGMKKLFDSQRVRVRVRGSSSNLV